MQMKKERQSRWGVLKTDNKEAYQAALPLKEGGMMLEDIAIQLNEKGHSTGSGKQFNKGTIHQLLSNRGRVGRPKKRRSSKVRRKARAPRTAAYNVPVSPKKSALEDKIELLSLVMASNISETRKIDVIKGLVNG